MALVLCAVAVCLTPDGWRIYPDGFRLAKLSNNYQLAGWQPINFSTGEGMPWAEFLSYARGVKEKNRQAPATAPKEVIVFDVQDQTASGKVVAWWGTDYILLGKYDGKWMIRQVMWQTLPPR